MQTLFVALIEKINRTGVCSRGWWGRAVELLGQEGLRGHSLGLSPVHVSPDTALQGMQRIRHREMERSRGVASSPSFLHCLHNWYPLPDIGFHVTFSPLCVGCSQLKHWAASSWLQGWGDQGQQISVPALSDTGCLTCSEVECLLGSSKTEEDIR